MEWIQLDQGEVTEHGSTGLHLVEVARVTIDGHFRTHVAQLAPGGVLGRHPGRWWQLFYVAAGSGWVSTENGARHPIVDGQAVLWAPEEDHESGSADGMTVVMVQSSVPLPYGRTPTGGI